MRLKTFIADKEKRKAIIKELELIFEEVECLKENIEKRKSKKKDLKE